MWLTPSRFYDTFAIFDTLFFECVNRSVEALNPYIYYFFFIIFLLNDTLTLKK